MAEFRIFRAWQSRQVRRKAPEPGTRQVSGSGMAVRLMKRLVELPTLSVPEVKDVPPALLLAVVMRCWRSVRCVIPLLKINVTVLGV